MGAVHGLCTKNSCWGEIEVYFNHCSNNKVRPTSLSVFLEIHIVLARIFRTRGSLHKVNSRLADTYVLCAPDNTDRRQLLITIVF